MFKSNVIQNGDFKKIQERKTNALRHKTSRYSVVRERRKMTEDINYDSIIDSAVESKNVDRKKHPNNSRSALLQEWRLKKEKMVNQESKKAKAKFVVKHVEQKISIFTEYEKEQINTKPINPKNVNSKNIKSILKEKNTNVNHTQSKQNDIGKISKQGSGAIKKQDDSEIRKYDYSLRTRKKDDSEGRPLNYKNENTKVSKESSCRNDAKSSKNSQIINNGKKPLKQNLALVDDKKISLQNQKLSNDKKISLQNQKLLDDKKISPQNQKLLDDKKILQQNQKLLDNKKISLQNQKLLNDKKISLRNQKLLDDKKISPQNQKLLDDKKISLRNQNLLDYKKTKSSMKKNTPIDDKKTTNEKNVLSELFGSESMIEKFNDFSFEEMQGNVSETFIVGPFSFQPPVGLGNINFEFDKSLKEDQLQLQSPDSKKNSSGVFKMINKTSENHTQNNVALTNNLETPNVALIKTTALKYIASLRSEKIADINSPMNTEGFVSSAIRTPLSIFKKKEGIPQGMLFISPNISKKNVTPNPKNFFNMKEDPVAQRVNSPFRIEIAPNQKVSDSVENFTKLVAAEEAMFTSSINKWNKILENGVPEEVQGDILAAIGQAQLFTKKRFKQFKELIELHKDKNAEKVALASDLDGFWDMIYFQVKDVHKRFSDLDVLEKNNWEKSVCHQNEQKEKPIKKKKPAIKKVIQSNVLNKDKKRPDFRQFRQQMMLKNQDNKVDTVLNELEPLSFINSVTIERNDAVVVNDEFSADSLEEASPDKLFILNKENYIPLSNLRRSSRKTPSKYRFIESQKTMTPKSVACKLFTDSIARHDLQPTSEFTKYLSKTVIIEDATAKCDLLSSFNDVRSEVRTQPKQLEDLMMFSPLNQ